MNLIKNLAQLAMSPDELNRNLFMSYPVEDRLEAFDWWWDNLEHHECETKHLLQGDELGYYHLDYIYKFGSAEFSILCLNSYGVNYYDDTQLPTDTTDYLNTDDIPREDILNKIYNNIKEKIIL